MTITLYERRRGGHTLVHANHNAFQFPGGEAHVVLDPTTTVQVAYVQGASGDDLFQLAIWVDACKRHGGLTTVLALPYLPAARQDRGSPLSVKVYADFINSLNIDHVVALDPHSDVAPALYDRLTVVPLTDLRIWDYLKGQFDGVIIPDVGAVKRAEAVADRLGLVTYQASKKRDFATGKLSGFHCEPIPPDTHMLVVDDICDGGGTFIGLAQAIRDQGNTQIRNLSLWVTHGIFSKGVDDLENFYTGIYNTDSHPGFWNNPNRTGANILSTLINHVKGI